MATRLSRVERALRDVARALDQRSRRWALVGGLAVSARAEPRTTRDVDVAVDVADDLDAERLVADLGGAGFSVLATIEQTAKDRLATVRLAAPSLPGTIVDLLFASSGIEGEVASAAERIDITKHTRVPVATAGHLLALKVLSRDDDARPQDAHDIRRLLDEASPADLAEARRACQMIVERGYHRSRDLPALLETAIEHMRRPLPPR